MVQINSVRETAFSVNPAVNELHGQMRVSPNYHSSIRSANEDGAKSKISRIITAPFRFVFWIFSGVAKFLKNYIFCCCKYHDSDSIDWEETKDIFDEIHTAVFPSKHGDFPTDRQKRFTKAFNELSQAAQERFREHIGLVLAKRAGKTERAEQIQWYKDNRELIKFHDDYFGNISNNKVLEEAINAFQKELDEKTK